MKKEEKASKRGKPIIVESGGVRVKVEYRHSQGDEGLTFDITGAGEKEGRGRLLRFDCFNKRPHYHLGPSGRNPVHDMKDEGIDDPVRWTLDRLKTQLPSMLTESGYGEMAKMIDQRAVAQSLSRVEQDILAI